MNPSDIDLILVALKRAREYVATVHGTIRAAVGHENTIVKPDLDMIDAAIKAAEKGVYRDL